MMEHDTGTHLITLDIETIPDQRPGAEDAARDRISAPSNYKDPVKIEAYIAEKAAEAWRMTSLNGAYGEIICIGFAIGDDEPTAYWREVGGDEAELLESFWQHIDETTTAGPTWIGHRVVGFDLRFLWQRSVLNGVPPSRPLPLDAGPWSREVFDTGYAWTGDRSRGIRLAELARIFGMEAKSDMDGSEVWDAVQAGRIKDVVSYCMEDVRITRELYRRMRFGVMDPPGA